MYVMVMIIQMMAVTRRNGMIFHFSSGERSDHIDIARDDMVPSTP